MAWRSKGDGQDKYPVICEYADEWINYAGYRIRSYFVCICAVLVASKMWPRLHKEIDSTGQRCYCPQCTRRYRAGFGQIVEIMTPDNTVLYARAALAMNNEVDVCRMEPMMLWRQLYSYEPVSGTDIVRAATDADFCWPDKEELRRSMAILTDKGQEALKEVHIFDWTVIFNID